MTAHGREYVVTGGVYNWTTQVQEANSSLVCLDSLGAKLWDADIGSGFQVGSPLLFADLVVVPSANGKVYAFNANNGSKLWAFDTYSASQKGVTSSPCAYLNQIYVGAMNGKLFCLDADGEQVWNTTVASSIYSSSPWFLNGMLYIGADDGKLHAIGTNGTQAWSTTLGTEVRGFRSVLDDKIVVTFKNSTASNGGLAAVSYSGKLLWKTVTGVSPASAALTSIGFASITNTGIVMVGFDGAHLWNVSLGTSFAGAAPTAVNGTIYMVTNEATSRLLAISEAGEVYSPRSFCQRSTL